MTIEERSTLSASAEAFVPGRLWGSPQPGWPSTGDNADLCWAPIESQVAPFEQKVCQYHDGRGGCRHGDQCFFYHAELPADGSNEVYVGNLEDGITDHVLGSFFRRYGTVLRTFVKERRGYGFVVFVESAAAKKAISCGHPEWDVEPHRVDEAVMRKVDPLSVHFTHDTISFCFRNGTKVDDAIHKIIAGKSSFADFPPMEVVQHAGCYYSLSNRRLFVARVLATQGLLSEVHVRLFEFSSERMQQKRGGRTKWDRSFSTVNKGLCVFPNLCGVCQRDHESIFMDQQAGSSFNYTDVLLQSVRQKAFIDLFSGGGLSKRRVREMQTVLSRLDEATSVRKVDHPETPPKGKARGVDNLGTPPKATAPDFSIGGPSHHSAKDPFHFAVGTMVRIQGLHARPRLNGLVGRITSYVPERERYGVELSKFGENIEVWRPDVMHVELGIKPLNLTIADESAINAAAEAGNAAAPIKSLFTSDNTNFKFSMCPEAALARGEDHQGTLAQATAPDIGPSLHSANDPIHLAVGTMVRIQGLHARQQLNGLLGRITSYVPEKERYGVELSKFGENIEAWRPDAMHVELAIKPLNLTTADESAINAGAEAGNVAAPNESLFTSDNTNLKFSMCPESALARGEDHQGIRAKAMAPDVPISGPSPNNANDPIHFAVGAMVRIQGLHARPQLNGLVGCITSYVAERERYGVEVSKLGEQIEDWRPDAMHVELAIKPLNLTIADESAVNGAADAANTAAPIKSPGHFDGATVDRGLKSCLHIGDKVYVHDPKCGGRQLGTLERPCDDKWLVRRQDYSLVEVQDVLLARSHSKTKKCQTHQILAVQSSQGGRVESVSAQFLDYGSGSSEPVMRTRKVTRPRKLPLLFPGTAKWKRAGVHERLCRWTKDARLASHLAAAVQPFGQREIDGHWVHWQWVAKCTDGLEESNLRTLDEWNAINVIAGYCPFLSTPGIDSGERVGWDVIRERCGQLQRRSGDEPSYDVPASCEFCGKLGLDLPQCECGETYCSAACRLADWKDHKRMCCMAICGTQIYNRITRLYWIHERGADKDLEGMPLNIQRTPDFEPDESELAASMNEACKQQ